MRPKNRVLEAVRAGKRSIGMEIMLGDPRLIEMFGWEGFDFVQLDMEHAPYDFLAIENQVRAAQGAGLTAIVRVAENRHEYIRRALECGAECIVVPRVSNVDEVRYALNGVRFAPEGQRGMCPVTRAARYQEEEWADYQEWLHSEVTLVPLIESVEGMSNLDDIFSLPEVVVAGFGAGDYGQSVGVGTRGMKEQVVREAFELFVRKADEHGVAVKAMPVIVGSVQQSLDRVVEKGASVIVYDADVLILQRSAREIVQTFRSFDND